MDQGKKIYFASDLHLGAPTPEKSREREIIFVSWLDQIKSSCSTLYLLGDVFDFWFEYKRAVPRGYVRLLAKLAEFTDSGIPVYIMKGNHDMWMFSYLQEEIGAKVIDQPYILEHNGLTLYLAHGDGLGPKQRFYKTVSKLYRSRICQWLFARIHPNLGIHMAASVSKKSRESHTPDEADFLGENKEYLLLHSKEVLKSQHIDYFIYGHRHIVLDYQLTEKSKCINLGDWITYFTYAEFDGEKVVLKYFNKEK